MTCVLPFSKGPPDSNMKASWIRRCPATLVLFRSRVLSIRSKAEGSGSLSSSLQPSLEGAHDQDRAIVRPVEQSGEQPLQARASPARRERRSEHEQARIPALGLSLDLREHIAGADRAARGHADEGEGPSAGIEEPLGRSRLRLARLFPHD